MYIPNLYFCFEIPSGTPLNLRKSYKFLRRKVAKIKSMAPKELLYSCQLIQIMEKLASMTPQICKKLESMSPDIEKIHVNPSASAFKTLIIGGAIDITFSNFRSHWHNFFSRFMKSLTLFFPLSQTIDTNSVIVFGAIDLI